ncbi:MAG: serine/threonine protein phosphatase [Gracilibacter sp. BRH_c7a]|nr:MAG: serine/threonine protein phosphatase [Gracilibacter sp. BRH_c7a]
MNTLKRISKVFESAKEISFDDSSKIILMSDVHRGDGSWADNFARNKNIYNTALNHYYNENYTYIEIGDGDELWQNKKLSEIVSVHSDVFKLIAQFFREDRFYLIFGNHDMVYRDENFVREKLFKYFDEEEKAHIHLCENIKAHEGLVLKHSATGQKILLMHGHQADFLDYDLWKLARFLVRYLWTPLELLGLNDPTRAAKNYSKKEAVERELNKWVAQEEVMLICGHTHRPMFPEVGQLPYFNDGSCVHPRGITGIEITDGNIALIKWSIKAKSDGTLFIGKDVLAGPQKLTDYM